MTLHDELLDLEEKGWQALSSGRGAEFYDAFMTDDAIMVLPFALLDRAGTVATMRDTPPWSTHKLEDVRVIELGDGIATIVYSATAQREGQPVYRALMSTTYVRQDDEWLVAIHQQTPLPED